MKLWIRNILQNIINSIESEEDKTLPEDYLKGIMEQLKVGDLVETCQFLPGFITSIDGDDITVFIPGKHDFSDPCNKGGCHSIKHCGVHKIDSEYAMKLFLIGEERLRELWLSEDPALKNYTWEEIVNNEYLKII